MRGLETGIVTHPTVHADWDRYFERRLGRGNRYVPDSRVWEDMINLVVRADDLGYDFVFAPEHHVSPYGLSPDPLQWMTYVAGRTRRINLGTSVVVLPWHHPLRVAEQMSLLDNVAPGRRKLFGVARGVAPFEYAALQVPYDDRRARFDESVDIIKLALTEDSFSYDGEIFTLPEMTLRPQPVNRELADSLLVAATSDETLVEGGKRGLGLLYAGQKSTDFIRTDLAALNTERTQRGWEPVQPVLLVWMVCASSEQAAYERFVQAIGVHLFELTNNYAQAMWDESPTYADFVTNLRGRSTTEDHAKVQAFIDKQVWGTPAQCLEKVRAIQEGTGASNISFQIQFGDLTNTEALDTITAFAGDRGLDKLHSIPADPPDWLIEDAYAASAPAAVAR
ncbi:MAG TPA: LLM class flavin-dependent oxidoreductase [Acidimicrobiales bacterium]|nr:LLM class flavin-dependent oxidoreductase [Acidimicrobiales bacterium]